MQNIAAARNVEDLCEKFNFVRICDRGNYAHITK
jgi:hypothetical protein